MPFTVKFGTGQSVNFAKQPSPQDVEEASNHLGINQPSSNGLIDKAKATVQSAGTEASPFLANLGKNIIKAPATLAVRAGQLAGVGIAHALPQYFDPAKADQAADIPQKIPGLGVDIKPISQETPESLTGEAASTLALGAGPTLGGALAGGGSAMQDNKGPLNVAGNAVLGGATGYLGGRALDWLGGKLHPTAQISKTLLESGASSPAEAPTMAKILHDGGLTNFNDPHQAAITSNWLTNQINGAEQYIASQNVPDAISGELPSGVTDAMHDLHVFKAAQEALHQAMNVPDIGPGLFGKFSHGAARAAGGLLKPIVYSGLGAIGISEGTNPNSIVRKLLTEGGL